MTQYGLSLGQLIQNGLARGAGMYESGQAMAMQREAMARQAQMDAITQQLRQQELAQRFQAAREYDEQRVADREYMDLYSKTFLSDPVSVAPAPRAGMGPSDEAEPVAVVPSIPQIDMGRLSMASPRVQERWYRALENKQRERDEIKREREHFGAMIGTGVSSFYGPKEDTPEAWSQHARPFREARDRGDVSRAELSKYAPRKVMEMLDAEDRAHHERLVDFLTIGAGPDGKPAQDDAMAAMLSSYPIKRLEAMADAKRAAEQKQAEAMAQTRVLHAAYAVVNDPNATPADRAMAQAVLAQQNAPLGTGAAKPGAVSISNDRTVQSFKALLDLVDTETKGKDGADDIARRRTAAEAYQASLAGRVTPDGWAIINGGQPRSDGAYLVVRSDGARGWIAGDALRDQMNGGGSRPEQQPSRDAGDASGGGGSEQEPATAGDATDRLIDDLIDEAIGGGQ